MRASVWTRPALMLALTALASACTPAPSRPVVAPAVVAYSREFQARAADGLDARPPACRPAPPGADCFALRVLLVDAAELRAHEGGDRHEVGEETIVAVLVAPGGDPKN